MLSLYRKEINSFFSSVTGYLVIIVFLLLNSSFMWIFKGGTNVIEGGYASLSSLFSMAPWIFLFLVPAITMRMFAEEKKAGTLELLYTRPVTEWKIVLSKFLSAWSLVLFSLIPTLIYYFSVSHLASPPGNIDHGGTLGAYTGLIFLGGIYSALGVFSSSLTENQIVAFIIAVVLSFMFYLGFDFLSTIFSSGRLSFFIEKMGIEYHYQSVSRGVLDSRDLLYFTGVIFTFLYATAMVITKNKN